METRSFEPADADAMERLFCSVFTASEGAAEGEMVSKLARDMMAHTAQDDLFGFVALDAGRIVGAILFTRLAYDSATDVFVLSPVAVDSEQQGKGVGSALICYGLGTLRQRGVDIVTTYGDPAYYTRLGFEPLSPDTLAPPFPLSQPIGWLGQALGGGPITKIAGGCRCVSALDNPAYW